mmetsp:Transcript_92146/g.166410  ORF Transcript_92146/g.166410 Transcript_92146/m.166410 type:complete len:80 (+) Transcript_92146:185-424(+)
MHRPATCMFKIVLLVILTEKTLQVAVLLQGSSCKERLLYLYPVLPRQNAAHRPGFLSARIRNQCFQRAALPTVTTTTIY